MSSDHAIVELRTYTTYPGTRDTLIELFEREFIESQEATGMRLIGQLRDANDADRFLWLRGFADMAARQHALTTFYGGPIWQAHRAAANATLYDNDDVLLLRPVQPFALDGLPRPPVGAAAPDGLVVITTYHFADAVPDGFAAWFDATVRPRIAGTILATLVSDHSPNSFPRLPVREGVHAFVWLARYPSRAAYDDVIATLGRDLAWRTEHFAALRRQLARPPELVFATPTPRSLL